MTAVLFQLAGGVAVLKARLELRGRQVDTGSFDVTHTSRDPGRGSARAAFVPAGA